MMGGRALMLQPGFAGQDFSTCSFAFAVSLCFLFCCVVYLSCVLPCAGYQASCFAISAEK